MESRLCGLKWVGVCLFMALSSTAYAVGTQLLLMPGSSAVLEVATPTTDEAPRSCRRTFFNRSAYLEEIFPKIQADLTSRQVKDLALLAEVKKTLSASRLVIGRSIDNIQFNYFLESENPTVTRRQRFRQNKMGQEMMHAMQMLRSFIDAALTAEEVTLFLENASAGQRFDFYKRYKTHTHLSGNMIDYEGFRGGGTRAEDQSVRDSLRLLENTENRLDSRRPVEVKPELTAEELRAGESFIEPFTTRYLTVNIPGDAAISNYQRLRAMTRVERFRVYETIWSEGLKRPSFDDDYERFMRTVAQIEYMIDYQVSTPTTRPIAP